MCLSRLHAIEAILQICPHSNPCRYIGLCCLSSAVKDKGTDLYRTVSRPNVRLAYPAPAALSASAPQFGICTLGIGEAEYLAQSHINKQDYAKKHGYNLYWWSETLDAERHPAWSKILAIL